MSSGRLLTTLLVCLLVWAVFKLISLLFRSPGSAVLAGVAVAKVAAGAAW